MTENALNIAVVEDDPADAKVLQKYLADFFAHSGRKCNVEVFGDREIF